MKIYGKNRGWVNVGTTESPSYHFFSSKDWPNKKREKEIHETYELVKNLSDDELHKINDGWLTLVKNFPQELYEILVFELREGNELIDISAVNWPSIGSIVGTLKRPFNEKSKKANSESGLAWRSLNDVNYCQEEISQNRNGVEHLLIR